MKGCSHSARHRPSLVEQKQLLWQGIERLHLVALPIEEFALDVDPELDLHIVFVLPHAHVVPDMALGSLRLDGAAAAAGKLPSISVVQMPCCSYIKHDTVCG